MLCVGKEGCFSAAALNEEFLKQPFFSFRHQYDIMWITLDKV